MLALLVFAQLALAHLQVMDGDTVHAGGAAYRLAGVDAPEIGTHAACPAEAALGDRAANRVRQLVKGPAAVTATAAGPEARPAATVGGWPVDRYGRRLAHLSIDGKDLGDTLIGEGLAVRWTGRKHDWCRRP